MDISNSERRSRIRTRAFIGLVVFLIGGCELSSEKIEFKKAEQAEQAKNHKAALGHYDNLVKRYVKSEIALKAAAAAGRIAYYELEDYTRALDFYKHIVLYSQDGSARKDAQIKIAEINFEHLQNYPQAIIEYHRLLELSHEKKEELLYRVAIAKSYFYLNNFFQALVEANAILARDYAPGEIFDVLELKANILLQAKRLDEAVELLKSLLATYPKEAKDRQIGLVLAVCYEEKKDFLKAIETLQSIKATYPNKDFIDARIKDLRERQSFLPGARGLRK